MTKRTAKSSAHSIIGCRMNDVGGVDTPEDIAKVEAILKTRG
jgi:hypothetical protein